ncbi:unnamed protein product [Heterobilharzia americana]|nr:unnamed protein product [Heterobilharzia americana]
MVKANRLHNFELLQEKLDKETNALEQKMLDVKPWYLQGEVVAAERSENTLLEEHFDVQRHGLFKPGAQDEDVINNYIIKAIKERTFDSPVFKVKEVEKSFKELPLQNVVQKSLVEEYESFLRRNKILEEDQGDPKKNAIQAEISELFDSLDRLSSLHFVPHKIWLLVFNTKLSNNGLWVQTLYHFLWPEVGSIISPHPISVPHNLVVKLASS